MREFSQLGGFLFFDCSAPLPHSQAAQRPLNQERREQEEDSSSFGSKRKETLFLNKQFKNPEDPENSD